MNECQSTIQWVFFLDRETCHKTVQDCTSPVLQKLASQEPVAILTFDTGIIEQQPAIKV